MGEAIAPILQVAPGQEDEERELAFELNYLASLTVQQRFEMMFQRSREILEMLIRQYLLQTDIHPFVAGVTFDQVWESCVEGMVGGTTAWFASLDDLIRMKEAAGRRKDIEDLRALRKLRERR